MFRRILSLPRFRLATFPTPIEKSVRIGSGLGIELYFKRDDVMELALGGNKVRKLEFILGDALSKGCDTLVTVGALHSNHARLTAAAARKAGLRVVLVLAPPPGRELQGNLLLDRVLGADVVVVDDRSMLEEEALRVVEKLRSEGRKPYYIPAGGASGFGVLGYALAALEIVEQLYSRGVKPRYIVHTTGTGATQAGLVLGLKLLGLYGEVKVVGISNGRTAEEVKERVSKLVAEASGIIGADVSADPEEVIVYDRYTFGGYGAVTKEVVETIRYVASEEGILLDPVYTAKGFYGLMDLVERGEIERGSTVVFIHTGGTPILFQYASTIAQYLQ